MKKVFYSFAIATMMASLMACGGKTEQNTEGQDSTAVEAAEEEVDPNREEHRTYSIVVPEGWINQSIVENDFFVRQNPEPKYQYNTERLMLSMTFMGDYSAERFVKSHTKWQIEEIEKVKIDDVEATAYHFTNERDTVIKILADKYGALYNFETNEKSYSNPDIQTILKSIKLKDIKESLAKENNQ